LSDKFQQLREKVTDPVDQADLADVHNARILSMQAYRAKPGKATLADKEACLASYEDTVDRLWRKYFPTAAKSASVGDCFRDKKAAFAWYRAEGGDLEYSAFAAKVTAVQGRQIARLAVSEMLREESRKRRKTPAASMAEFDSARDEARYTKARADREELRRDEEQRAVDTNWIQKPAARSQRAALVGLLRDSLRHHAHRAVSAIIHLSGGDVSRAPEVYECIEKEILAKAFNEVAAANKKEILLIVEE
jgi:hypothetical protein